MAAKPDAISLDELLQRYGESDPTVFSELYRRTKTTVYSYIRRYLRNSADVDEAFQETYFRLHRYVATYDATKGGMFWLLTIARNVVYDRLKVIKGLPELDDAAVARACGPGTADGPLDWQELLEMTCAELSDEDRTLLVQRIFLERSFDEIAQDLQSTSASVRQRVSRLRRRMRSSYTLATK